jgi:hypothetical protein
MTNPITQSEKAAALLFSAARISHANRRLCDGVINLAADMFNVNDVDDLDEDQLSEILDAIHECEQHEADMRELDN